MPDGARFGKISSLRLMDDESECMAAMRLKNKHLRFSFTTNDGVLDLPGETRFALPSGVFSIGDLALGMESAQNEQARLRSLLAEQTRKLEEVTQRLARCEAQPEPPREASPAIAKHQKPIVQTAAFARKPARSHALRAAKSDFTALRVVAACESLECWDEKTSTFACTERAGYKATPSSTELTRYTSADSPKVSTHESGSTLTISLSNSDGDETRFFGLSSGTAATPLSVVFPTDSPFRAPNVRLEATCTSLPSGKVDIKLHPKHHAHTRTLLACTLYIYTDKLSACTPGSLTIALTRVPTP